MAHQIGHASGKREVEGPRFCHPLRALQLRCSACGPCSPACGRAWANPVNSFMPRAAVAPDLT
eukprot:9278586-Pyramimonas_sp.AAC.1